MDLVLESKIIECINNVTKNANYVQLVYGLIMHIRCSSSHTQKSLMLCPLSTPL